jgi:hypothetical protein
VILAEVRSWKITTKDREGETANLLKALSIWAARKTAGDPLRLPSESVVEKTRRDT